MEVTGLNPRFTAAPQDAVAHQPQQDRPRLDNDRDRWGVISASSTTPQASGGVTLPNSTYTWVFQANSGNAWGGWLVADSMNFAVGDSIAKAMAAT